MRDLFAMLFGSISVAERKRQQLAKQIRQIGQRSKLKFYNTKENSANPALGQFFYAQYRLLCTNQDLFYKAKDSKVLRTVVIESFLGQEHRTLSAGLTKTAIEGLVTKNSIESAKHIVEERLHAFGASFSLQLRQQIDHFYNNLLGFINLAIFDYHFLLKRFDSSLPDCNLYYRPNMRSTGGRVLSDMLKDWLEAAMALSTQTDWRRVAEVLRLYARIPTVPISARKLQRTMAFVHEVLQTDILALIVRYIDRNFTYQPTTPIRNERICEPYLRDIRSLAEDHLVKLASHEQSQSIDALVARVFGATLTVNLTHYTETKNALLSKSPIKLRYTAELNYVHQFLSNEFEHNILVGLQEILILRANWRSRGQSRRFSQLVHQLKDLRTELEEFDESLSERTNLGEGLTRLVLALRAGNIVGQNQFKHTIEEINKNAFYFITNCYQAMLAVLRFMKPIIEDLTHNRNEIVGNWEEMRTSIHDLAPRLRAYYESMYYFLQLTQLLLKQKETGTTTIPV